MLALWGLYRRSEMGAPGHLPQLGGALEQAAITLDALRAMDGAYAELEAVARARSRPRGRGH